MRAIQFASYGGPEVLSLVSDAAEPMAGPGQVRIRVLATGVNPFDTKLRSGMIGQALTGPVIPGLEASGVIDQIGEGVVGVAPDEAVFGLGSATYAEFAVLHAWAAKPPGLSFAEAAGLAVAGETGQRVLSLLALEPGQVVVVHGAAGGVGQSVVQLAREAGLLVIGTASVANHELLRDLGAMPVTYGDGLTARVAELAPDGVDGVIDTAGSQLADLLAIAGSPDKVVTIANFGAKEAGVRFTGGGGDAMAALARVAELAGSGRYRVRLAQAFDLTEAALAQELSASRKVAGKLVLTLS